MNAHNPWSDCRDHTIAGGGGLALHVREAGNQAGRPLLFLHGFSQCGLCWEEQFADPALRDTCRLVALDLRGHGRSEKPADADAYADGRRWADDVRAVINTLGLDRPVLVGWSYGGLVICDYLRHHGPGAVAGLVLVGAITRQGGRAGVALVDPGFLQLVPGFYSTDLAESIGTLEAFIHRCTARPLPESLYYRLLGYNALVPPHVRRALFSRRLDNDDLLTALTLPTLICHGEQDAIVRVNAAHQNAGLIPGARLALYPDAGHSLFMEAPARFNADLLAFLPGLPG